MTGVICGTGSCVPVHTLDNHDIAKLVDTSDEWIRERGWCAAILLKRRLRYLWRQKQGKERWRMPGSGRTRWI